MTKNVQNFIDSKDNLYYNIPTNIILHGTIVIFCAVEILFYLLQVEYAIFRSSLFGFIFSISIAGLDILNILVRIVLPKEKIQHAYYGICVLLISLFLNYLTIKVGLLPFNQFFGFLAIGLFLLTSFITIYAINDNIKNNRYDIKSESIYWFKNQKEDGDGKKYFIVVTKHTIICALIHLVLAIVLIAVYFVFISAFPESDKAIIKYSHVGLIFCLLFLDYVTLFAWKFIIKQYLLNKMDK